MLKQGRLSQVGLMAALLKSVGRLKRRGGSSPSSSANIKLKLFNVYLKENLRKDFVMNLLLESHVLLQERLALILNV